MARRYAAPATLTAHHDCEFREVLDRVPGRVRAHAARQAVHAAGAELVAWLQTHWSTIRAARESFDRRSPRRKAS